MQYNNKITIAMKYQSFRSDKILTKDQLLSFKGGDYDYGCCELICFGEQFDCGYTGTGYCGEAPNPDHNNCFWSATSCDNC